MASVMLTPEAERVLRDYEAAWTGRDAAKLAALFHPEGFVLSSGRPPVQGRDAIAQHYKGAGGALHLRAAGYAAADTIGYIVGLYRHTSQVGAQRLLAAGGYGTIRHALQLLPGGDSDAAFLACDTRAMPDPASGCSRDTCRSKCPAAFRLTGRG